MAMLASVVSSSSSPNNAQTVTNTQSVPCTQTDNTLNNVLGGQWGTPDSSSGNSNIRLPSLSASNLQLIKNGKYVNFDLLLPAALSSNQAGFSLQVDPSQSLEGDHSVNLLPRVSKRTIRNFSSWLGAWNIFVQTFLHFFPSFVGGLLAYQSQITIYASRYDFQAWATYDRQFRQNMANTHHYER